MSNFGRNLALWVIIALLLVVLFNLFQPGTTRTAATQVAYSDFINEVNGGRVRDVVIQGRTVSGQLTDGRTFQTYTPEDASLVGRLTDKGVRVIAKPEDSDVNPLLHYLLSWFPMLLLIGVWVFFMRQMQAGGGRAMGFGKSRARMLTEKQGRVTFDDVAGIDEAKAELQEIVEFLKDPQKFQRLGGKIPKGVLLVGPPGTGKTLLARAIAGEANVPFFTISGSDFVEMFVGVGASRVRDMFEQGKKNAPCIIFIDEIDAVGRHRGAGLGGGNDEREQTLNQMLVEMDGFESNEGVILIAATNRPDVLDPALLRPGRFDRQVVVPNPDVNGREKILRVHMRKVPLASDVDPKVIARGTPGFSGADLANLVNEAALLAARIGKRVVAMAEFEHAKDKVMMGTERRSLVMSEAEKRMTAYHEGGHALCAMHEPECDPVHKATIIPARAGAGPGDEPAGGRSLLQEQVQAAGRTDHGDGRARGGGDHLRPGQGVERRRRRHQDGHRPGAADDHRVGHERQARHDRLWRQQPGGVPRPLGDAEQERVGGDGARDRWRDQGHHRPGLRQGEAAADRERRGTASAGARPAGARDAVRRRNPHGAAGRAGDPQGGGRTGTGEPACLGAERRPAGSADAACRGSGAGAAAGVAGTQGRGRKVPLTAGRASRLDVGGPATAEPITVGFGDAMRALFEPLGGLELPEIERRARA